MPSDAFVSYTRLKDQFKSVTKFVERLQNQLRRKSGNVLFSVFQDRSHISPGEKWPDKLAAEVQAAKVLVVLLSPTWIKSTWCKAEYSLFTKVKQPRQKKRIIVPLLWDSFPPAHLLPLDDEESRILAELRKIHYADWSTLQYDTWSATRPNKALSALAESIIKRL